jgi:soluble lytic murein transglycosylase-like protein
MFCWCRMFLSGVRNTSKPASSANTSYVASGDGNPQAVSPKGAVGVMQMMPETAARYGASDPSNTAQNIEASARFLSHLWRKYGNMAMILAAYNAGGGAVDKYRGVPPFPETQEYVRRGMRQMPQGAAR